MAERAVDDPLRRDVSIYWIRHRAAPLTPSAGPSPRRPQRRSSSRTSGPSPPTGSATTGRAPRRRRHRRPTPSGACSPHSPPHRRRRSASRARPRPRRRASTPGTARLRRPHASRARTSRPRSWPSRTCSDEREKVPATPPFSPWVPWSIGYSLVHARFVLFALSFVLVPTFAPERPVAYRTRRMYDLR
jgi:hypothetical protein